MPEIDLYGRETALICDVLRRHPKVSAAVLYGSRAKGTQRPESDIDLAIDGEVDDLQASAIAAEMDDLPLPHRFDVKAYPSIQSDALRDDIRAAGIVIWKNPQ